MRTDISLRLVIDGKPIPDFPFSLSGCDSPPDVLEVEPNSKVSAVLIGNFCVGDNPRFELSAGYDPDVRFVSRSINNKGSGKEGLLDDPVRNDLFQYVYGQSLLTLRYWDDFIGKDDKSRIVLSIRLNGRIVDKDKKRLYKSLRSYFQDHSNGQFLLESLHGQVKETFDLLFNPGYSSFDDDLMHLEYIDRLLDESFFLHLNGIVNHPFSTFTETAGFYNTAKHRRWSKRDYILTHARGTNAITVHGATWAPSFSCSCNNVIATFLHKILHRISIIRGHLGERTEQLKKNYAGDRDRIQKGKPIHNEIQQAESDKDVLLSKMGECDKLQDKLRPFCNLPVFHYSLERHTLFSDVSYSEFPKTIDYRFICRAIREYERTSFYWIGDESSFYRLPAFRYSEKGRDYWIRKYSMMYEYWCYLRIHETISNLGFSTDDHPGCARMQLSVFRRSDMVIYCYHDVHSERMYRPKNLVCPNPRMNTPDLVLVFENTNTAKIALVVLDFKSDPHRKAHMRKCWDYLETSIVGRRDLNLVFVQSWVVFSGEREQYKHPHMQQPIETPLSQNEYATITNSDIEADARLLMWKDGQFHARFTYDEEVGVPLKFIGYLQSHIRTQKDTIETDHFQEFIAGEIKLMEECLQ